MNKKIFIVIVLITSNIFAFHRPFFPPKTLTVKKEAKPVSTIIQPLVEQEEFLKQNSKPLNVVLLLDEDGSEYGYYKEDKKEAGAITLKLLLAIKQKVPFIISAHLLYILKHCEAKIFIQAFNSLETNKWKLYQNSQNTFIVGFPKDYINDIPNLQCVGINDENLHYIPPSRISIVANKTLPFLYFGGTIEQLKKLFTNPYARKRIYLSGHGLYSSELIDNFLKKSWQFLQYGQTGSIVSLSFNQYLDFMQFLNSQGTDLVYVASCYAGGYNLLLYQKYDEMLSNQIFLSYFLIIGSVSDQSTLLWRPGEGLNFHKFFEKINIFFAPQRTRSISSLASIFKSFALTYYKENIPSVRFPGKINYFNALTIDKETEIITYSKAIAHTLKIEPIIRKISTSKFDVEEEEPKFKVKKEVQPFNIRRKKAILIYPLFIEAPITITKSYAPTLISMIPGNAFHFFKTITFGDIHKLYTLFLDMHIASEKVYVIENLIIKKYYDLVGLPSGDLHYVIIDKKPFQSTSTIIAKVKDQFYKAIIKSGQKEEDIRFKPEPTQSAKQLISQILLNIKNKTLQKAVNQATGGQEEIEAVYQEIIKIFGV